ncbi:MAG: PRC-barrel domain-containing protein, partial [Geminicoccales bacterium]
GQEKQPEESPLAALPVSDVIGAEVMNSQGDQVAKIVDLVKMKGQDQVNAVLSVGGFLGIGDKKVALPLDKFDVTPDNKIVLASVSEDELKSMPKYDQAAYESVAGEQSKSEAMPAQQQ